MRVLAGGQLCGEGMGKRASVHCLPYALMQQRPMSTVQFSPEQVLVHVRAHASKGLYLN